MFRSVVAVVDNIRMLGGGSGVCPGNVGLCMKARPGEHPLSNLANQPLTLVPGFVSEEGKRGGRCRRCGRGGGQARSSPWSLAFSLNLVPNPSRALSATTGPLARLPLGSTAGWFQTSDQPPRTVFAGTRRPRDPRRCLPQWTTRFCPQPTSTPQWAEQGGYGDKSGGAYEAVGLAETPVSRPMGPCRTTCGQEVVLRDPEGPRPLTAESWAATSGSGPQTPARVGVIRLCSAVGPEFPARGDLNILQPGVQILPTLPVGREGDETKGMTRDPCWTTWDLINREPRSCAAPTPGCMHLPRTQPPQIPGSHRHLYWGRITPVLCGLAAGPDVGSSNNAGVPGPPAQSSHLSVSSLSAVFSHMF